MEDVDTIPTAARSSAGAGLAALALPLGALLAAATVAVGGLGLGKVDSVTQLVSGPNATPVTQVAFAEDAPTLDEAADTLVVAGAPPTTGPRGSGGAGNQLADSDPLPGRLPRGGGRTEDRPGSGSPDRPAGGGSRPGSPAPAEEPRRGGPVTEATRPVRPVLEQAPAPVGTVAGQVLDAVEEVEKNLPRAP